MLSISAWNITSPLNSSKKQQHWNPTTLLQHILNSAIISYVGLYNSIICQSNTQNEIFKPNLLQTSHLANHEFKCYLCETQYKIC